LERSGVPFDVISVLPRHLGHVPVLSERHPALRMVLDHLSHPPLGSADTSEWRTLIGQLHPAGRDAILGGTARRFYAFGPDTTPKPTFTLGLDA
jgi:predicted TIM-barrel fold metal-dependent hydrolase